MSEDYWFLESQLHVLNMKASNVPPCTLMEMEIDCPEKVYIESRHTKVWGCLYSLTFPTK
jgi:hypothetical protein